MLLDLIYIVDDELGEQSDSDSDTPNFRRVEKGDKTYPVPEACSNLRHKITVSESSSSISLGGMIGFAIAPLPTALIMAATSGLPNILSMFTSESEDSKLTDEQIEQKEIEAKVVLERITHLSLSARMAKNKGYNFQPGHPLVGKAYKRHPLAEFDKNKDNLYIPSDYYDSILLEERESEMIKLLVHLGAKKITLTKKKSCLIEDKMKVSSGVEVEGIPGFDVSVNAGYENNTKYNNNALDTRDFILSGRKWTEDSQVDRTQFHWLKYEPSWESVVYARECGGCISASLELKETTSFTADKNIELAIKAKIVEAGIKTNFSKIDNNDVTYYVSVVFSEVE